MEMRIERPIPGQSLTTQPGNAPYERPPEIANPDEALEVHLVRLTEPERMDAALSLLESGIDLQTLVEGILRSAVMNGIHTVDTSLIIAPVIHEYIKLTADEVGVEYDEGFEEDDDKEARTYVVASTKARKKLEQMDMMPEEEDEEEAVEEKIVEGNEVEEDEMPQDKPKGLMSREMK